MIRRLLGDSTRERRLRTAGAIALATGLLFAIWVLVLNPFESLQRLAADAQARTQDGSQNVVIVAIDEDALDRHDRLSEWPRTLHSDVIASWHALAATNRHDVEWRLDDGHR